MSGSPGTPFCYADPVTKIAGETSLGSQKARWESARSLILPVVLVVVCLDLYAVWFVGSERTLFHADQLTYWSYSQRLSQLLAADPVAAIRAVGHSVANNDINLLPALPVACVMALFGCSRLVYILSVITLYGTATVLMLVLALRRFGLDAPSWVTPLVLLLVPTIWRPVFLGYLGIGGVALALAVLALVVPAGASSSSARSMALAGILLAVTVLYRRWWGIWAVAFCSVVVLVVLWNLVANRPRSLRQIGAVVAGPCVFGLTAGVTLIVLAAPVVVQRATTDYADRFAAYSLEGAYQRVQAAVGHIGILGVLLIVASACTLMLNRAYRRSAMVLVLVLALTYALMVSIQDHSPQHWYLYDPSILLLVGLAVGRLGHEFPPRRHPAAWAPLVVIGAVMTTAVFVPGVLPGAEAGIVPSDGLRPRVRNDLHEINRLLSFLDDRYRSGSGSVYVLASSEVLSDQALAFANLSLGTEHPSVRSFLASAHVDRRDGFPRGLLLADAVITTDPVQIHLRADEQRVVVEPARSFRDGTDIALGFQRLPVTFTLDGGVRAFVFERIRTTTVEELEGLSSRLREAYPDRPEIFAP